MELSKRIEKIVEYSGLSIPKFAEFVGFKTPQAVRELIKGNTKTLSFQAQEKIISSYPEINVVWLTTGEGDMLSSSAPPPPPDSDTRLVPIGSLDSKGGVEYNESVNTTGYITGYMPFSKTMAHEGDIVIPVYGHSMEPVYNDGCMVLIRKVEMWREYLELGCTYIVELMDDRRVIKTVTAGSDNEHFLLTSFNPAYPPQEVSRSFVRSVWRVIASIRRESL